METDKNALIDRFMRGDIAPDVTCGEEYYVIVGHSMKVAHCRDYSNEEQDRMFTALSRELKRKTEAYCGDNNECPYPEIVEVVQLRNECEDNVWTIDWSVKAKCVQ